MSTIYYAVVPALCQHCGKDSGHTAMQTVIGASARGWAFALRCYNTGASPFLGRGNAPETWGDWICILARPEVSIVNDSGTEVTLKELIRCVTQRVSSDLPLRRHEGNESHPVTNEYSSTYDRCWYEFD